MSAQQLITEHIDLWTSSIKARNIQGRGSSKKRELYGIKKLRELILELAVRGKLVPQDPNEEPASELLKRIAEEKAQLIKDKKIKSPKPVLDITEKEAAFELPKGWAWSLLPNISSYMTGKTPATKNSVFWGDTPSDYPWVSIADMNHYGRVIETKKKVTQEAVDKVFQYQPVKAGTILMSFKLTLGKVSILDVDAFHNEAIISISPFTGVSKGYLFRVLPERALAGNSKQAIKGKTLNSESIARIAIPLPPVEEQHRIVTKVDELMALCDQLEQQTESSLDAHNLLVDTLLASLLKPAEGSLTDARVANELSDNWARLANHFDTLITTDYAVEQLKQTILQLAVMGKLVPQDPNDEPASELLKRIAAEKEQLVKDKKIKRQKPLLEITDEEKPFELPRAWEWCRLPDLGDLARGKSKHRPRNDPTLYSDGKIPLVQTGDVSRANGVIGTYTALYNEVGLAQSKLWPKGTMCITIAANIADTSVLGFDACFPDSVVAYTPFDDKIDARYFEFFIRTAKANLEKYAPSTAQKNINLEILSQLLVPCPPLEEISNIVAKIDELMALCDQLKAQLSNAQITQLHLADAVLDRALG
jgi:type I restriction enzyme S subunit